MTSIREMHSEIENRISTLDWIFSRTSPKVLGVIRLFTDYTFLFASKSHHNIPEVYY